MRAISNIIALIRGEVSTYELVQRGLVVGKNFARLNQVIIDDSHPWLIEIGDDVTLAPRVHLLAHDSSTKKYLGYTKIGRVSIGNRVFIGAGTVVLPGVSIGDDVVVGANSTVTHDVPNGVVVAGCPARVLCSLDDYLAKERARMKVSPKYGEEFTMCGSIDDAKKRQQRNDLADARQGMWFDE